MQEKTYTVEVRYVEVYNLTILAETPELAVDKANDMAVAGQLPKTYGEWDAVVLEGGDE
ncbi:MAG TPA: hypothetical protein PLE99_05525 [Candidatus Thiothrix moscowensis]|uniref:hypothetical protein n=1 Tax=unclassified Thiothrix TaxID=2636184 RepID=UPI0025FA7FFF|nr:MULTISPECIES: hypothetical protein [unclassified Thiothrix]HRJ52203.1 hypothetical protein [Candidatus Thiothrix moscowensis]HRJ92518.1 hypothetical protein [Candidatus Thiothrix moscowensis]